MIDMKAAIATDAGEQPATVGADARQCGAERIGRGIEHQLRLTKRELPGIETTAIDIVAQFLFFAAKIQKNPLCTKYKGKYLRNVTKRGYI